MNFKKSLFVCLSLLLSLTYVHITKAHTALVITFPIQGAVLTHSPSEIRLQFNEPIGLGSTFVLFNTDFQQQPVQFLVDPERPNQLWASIPAKLPAGQYTVQWLVISQDQHQLSGSYSFQIIGEREMELVAESAAVNLPGAFAWTMIVLALITPMAVWMWAKNGR